MGESVHQTRMDSHFEILNMIHEGIVHEPHVKFDGIVADKLIKIGVHIDLGNQSVQINEGVPACRRSKRDNRISRLILVIHNCYCIGSISTNRDSSCRCVRGT